MNSSAKKFVCDKVHDDGRVMCESFEADSWEEAERIADGKGFVLLGQYVGETDCPAEVEAMIQLYGTKRRVH